MKRRMARPGITTIAFGVAAIGIALFSTMDAMMKHLVLALGAYNAMLWRMLAMIVLAGAGWALFGRTRPTRVAMSLHAQRGIVSAAMALLFFWGLARVPLAQGVALSFVAPLIALYLAALVLKETVDRRTILASALGFAGVLVILAGQAEAELGPDAFRGALAILASALLYAWNIVLMRRQALAAKPFEIAFFNSLFVGGCYVLVAPFLAEVPPAAEVPWLVSAALLAFGSLLLLA